MTAVDAGTAEITGVARELEGILERARSESSAPGVSAGVVLGDDGLAWSHAIGYADLEARRPLEVTTPVRIASITKTLTATAILQLRDEGRLSLEDPLLRHVPEFARASNPFEPLESVTLRGLLTHTSGLQYMPPLDDELPAGFPGCTSDEMLERLDRVRVLIPPGTWKYSNLAYDLLGEVIRRVSGRPLGAYLQGEICGPLGMAATGFAVDPAAVPQPAIGYAHSDPGEAPTRIPARPDDWADASGGLWSTIPDMAAWIGQQLRSDERLGRGPCQVLPGRTLREMHRQTVLANDAWTYGQGLGWASYRRGELVVVAHSGGLPGYRTTVAFSPADRFGVIVMFNCHTDAPGVAMELASVVAPVAREHHQAVVAARPPEPVPDAWLPIVGSYLFPERRTEWRLTVHGGRLVLDGPVSIAGRITFDATPDPDRFVLASGTEIGEPMRIVRDAQGRVVRMVMGGESYFRIEEAAASA